MDSKEVKSKLLAYWRFKRKYNYIATECGAYNSDILVANDNECVEVEVKVSKADLKNDFKKRKHKIYANGKSKWIPQKFYFGVPEELVSVAVEMCQGTQYGVICVQNGPYSPFKDFCKVILRAKKLNSKPLNEDVVRKIVMRMGSELINNRLQLG